MDSGCLNTVEVTWYGGLVVPNIALESGSEARYNITAKPQKKKDYFLYARLYRVYH